MQDALQRLLTSIEPQDDDSPLFIGHKRGTRLTVSAYGRMVKDWCDRAGLEGRYSSHSLRKTFGYTMRTKHNVGLAVLQDLYGHSSGRVTLKYVGIQGKREGRFTCLGSSEMQHSGSPKVTYSYNVKLFQ